MFNRFSDLMLLVLLTLVILGAVNGLAPAVAQTQSEPAKTLAHDGAEDGEFGGPTSISGDCDADHDVDLADFFSFQTCFTGPGGEPAGLECECVDFDGDGDVDLLDFFAFQTAFTGPGPSGPRIGGYSNSGCLPGTREDFAPCGDDEIELTVEGNTLYTVHRNATYNCCPDDIVVTLSVEGSVLALTEEEILTNPCYCICCYDVESTVVDLSPGEYTVAYCWYDYDTYQEECHVEDIVIP